MDIVDNNHVPPDRWHLVPVFKALPRDIEAQRQRLIWVPRGSPQIIRGIQTTGGFYLHRPRTSHISFAVDESLPVGRAENARPISLRPGQCVGYCELDLDQRAAYLQWLSCQPVPSATLPFCVRLHVAALEWSLFVERAAPSAIIDELLSVIACTDRSTYAPLFRLLAWAAFFQNRNVHIAVMEDVVGSGCRLDGSMARILLLDCAEGDRRIWPELGFEVICLFGGISDARICADFRDRYISRFRILYPDGLRVTTGTRRTDAEYKLHCPELRAENCRLLIQDALDPALSALREVAVPLISEKRIDLQKAILVAEETVRAQALLSVRNQTFPPPPSPAPQPLQKSQAVAELDGTNFEIMTKLIERAEWSELEFQRLAKGHGRMPFAVIERLNSWAMENFDEPLLEGGSSVVINTNLIKEIKQKYE